MLEAAHIRQTIERIPELPTDKYFLLLDLPETCLYMVHCGLGPSFRKLQK